MVPGGIRMGRALFVTCFYVILIQETGKLHQGKPSHKILQFWKISSELSGESC